MKNNFHLDAKINHRKDDSFIIEFHINDGGPSYVGPYDTSLKAGIGIEKLHEEIAKLINRKSIDETKLPIGRR